MPTVKCLCGTDIQLRDTITSVRSTVTKIRVEKSDITEQPIVVQVRPFDEDKPIFSHSYQLFCPECKIAIKSSNMLSDITDFVLTLPF